MPSKVWGVGEMLTSADLNTMLEQVCPAGTVAATVGAAANTGWLMLDGSTIPGADVAYPTLWGRVPAGWKSGTSLVLPDARGKTLFMDDSGGAFTLGALGGANAKTIATVNLPSHTHPIDHDHPSVASGAPSADHTHSIAHDHGAVTSTGRSAAHSHNAASGGFQLGVQGPWDSVNWDVVQANNGVRSFKAEGTGTESADHTHNVDLPAFAGNSGTTSASHTHNVDLPAFAGNSGATGGATDLDVVPAHLAINWQIKAH